MPVTRRHQHHHTTGRTAKPSMRTRLGLRPKHHTTRRTGAGTTTTTTTTTRTTRTTHGGAGATGVHHHKRHATIGDKVSGAMMKLRGSLTRRPGLKAAGTRRMHGTDGRNSHRRY